jgi:uncharacterized protein YecE (DUF72 family)
MEYYIGCSGWFYWHWKGEFYPKKLNTSKWFSYYAKFFNTVELNSPFYRFPKPTTAKAWYRNSPDGFVYSLKVNRIITHVKRFKGTQRLIREFYRLGDVLKEKMGCFLFQLPPSFKYDKNKLNSIIKQLDSDKTNVLEFRDISWFNSEVYDSLKKNNIIFCIVSSPKLPEEFIKTSKDVYIRFHGRSSWYSYKYSNKELKEWAKKLRKSKAKRLWAYFNNDANAFAVKNGLVLKKLITSSNLL